MIFNDFVVQHKQLSSRLLDRVQYGKVDDTSRITSEIIISQVTSYAKSEEIIAILNVSTLQVQFIMHLNKFKGLIFVLSLTQNIIYFIYGELFTFSLCTSSQIGQDPRTRSFALLGMLPQEIQCVLACISSLVSLCKRGKGRV